MSCRHDLALGNCKICYPFTGMITPDSEDGGLDGPGAISKVVYDFVMSTKKKTPTRRVLLDSWVRFKDPVTGEYLYRARKPGEMTQGEAKRALKLEFIISRLNSGPPIEDLLDSAQKVLDKFQEIESMGIES